MSHTAAHAVANGAGIGSKALLLLFVWLISAAASSWLSDRKGYGERLGLTLGLLLTALGLVIVLLLPGRPNSTWRSGGRIPRRRRFELCDHDNGRPGAGPGRA